MLHGAISKMRGHNRRKRRETAPPPRTPAPEMSMQERSEYSLPKEKRKEPQADTPRSERQAIASASMVGLRTKPHPPCFHLR